MLPSSLGYQGYNDMSQALNRTQINGEKNIKDKDFNSEIPLLEI